MPALTFVVPLFRIFHIASVFSDVPPRCNPNVAAPWDKSQQCLVLPFITQAQASPEQPTLPLCLRSPSALVRLSLLGRSTAKAGSVAEAISTPAGVSRTYNQHRHHEYGEEEILMSEQPND